MNESIVTLNNYISEGKCLLMIGPDIASSINNIPLHLELKKSYENDQNIIFDSDNFITFKSKKDKTFFLPKLKNFYEENSKICDIHKKIAQIPFNFIISISPDIILKKTFDNLGISCVYDFYDKQTNPKDVSNFSTEKPLIYNLFGSIKNEASLILTYDDLYDFLFAIIDDKKLPLSIKQVINEVKVFLFLGFDFEKWYMRLIIRMLNLKKEVTLAFENNFKTEPTKNFYINNLDMVLLPDDDNTVIDMIYKHFAKLGTLRQVKEVTENPIASVIIDFLKKDEIEKALENLEDFFSGKDESQSANITMIFNQFSGLQRRLLKGTVSEADANLEKNKIVDSILTITNEIKNME